MPFGLGMESEAYSIQAGLNPWLDREKLLPGQNWRYEINTAIKESAYFVALLSSSSVSKCGYVQKELKIAIEILDQHPASSFFLPKN